MKTDSNGVEVKVGDIIRGPGSGCPKDHEHQHLGQVREIGDDGVAVVDLLGTARIASVGRVGERGDILIDRPYAGAKVSMDIPNCVQIPMF